jgi:hypothetical protein
MDGSTLNTDFLSDLLKSSSAGLPDFSWYKQTKTGKRYQNGHKIYQKATKYTRWPQNTHTRWPQNIPNGSKIDELSIKFTNIFHCKKSKITQTRIFGLKICIPSGNTVRRPSILKFGCAIQFDLCQAFVELLCTFQRSNKIRPIIIARRIGEILKNLNLK